MENQEKKMADASPEKKKVYRKRRQHHPHHSKELSELNPDKQTKPTVKAWWVPKEQKRSHINAPLPDHANVTLSFITKQEQYAISQTPIIVKENMAPLGLTKLVRLCLRQASGATDLPEFEFLIGGKLVTGPIGDHMRNLDLSFEATVNVEYFERYPPPTPKDNLEHDDWVSSVMSCGDWLVTGCYDNTVHLWSVDSTKSGLGKRAHKLTIPAHKAPVKAVAWINTQERMKSFVSCSIDQTAIVWDWDSQNNSVECVWECRGHTRSVECLGVEPKGSRFVTGSWDNMIKIWDGNSQSRDVVEENVEEEPDKKRLKKQKSERLKTPIMTLAGHSESVSGVGWMDSNQFISCSWDHSIRLWDLTMAGMVSQINGNVAFFCLSYSPLNRTLVAGCADRHVRLYDPRSSEGCVVKNKYTDHTKWVPSVRWSATDENRFVSGSYDHSIRVWDRRSAKAPVFNLLGHDEKVLSVDWSFSNHIASGSADCTAQIYDIP